MKFIISATSVVFLTGSSGRLSLGGRRTSVLPAEPGVSDTGVVVGAWAPPAPDRIDSFADYLTYQEAAGDLRSCRTMIGELVTISDSFRTWDGVAVLDCSGSISALVDGRFRLSLSWLFQAPADDPTNGQAQ